MKIIEKYFRNLTDKQRYQFSHLHELYNFWNEQINVVSRQDIDNLYERHVLHSLAIAKVYSFKKNQSVLDVGTGGGFPGIPLAILFPDVNFYLCDSIRRKIKVVTAVAEEIKLKNVVIDQARSEQIDQTFDYIVCRAVSKLPKFVSLIKKNLNKSGEGEYPNGLFYLKGGEIDEELAPYNGNAKVFQISDFFEEEFFETKKIVYLPHSEVFKH